jgi:hypothetical protein
MLARSQARKGIVTRWYIQNIHHQKNQTFFSVRPWLHGPEIDPVDKVLAAQILLSDHEKSQLQPGDRVEYVIA